MSLSLSIYLSIYLYRSIYLSVCLWLYSPLLDLGRILSFLPFLHSREDSLTGNRPVTRGLPAHRTAQTQNRLTQTSMPQVGFEPTIPLFERAKTVYAIDRAATVIGAYQALVWRKCALHPMAKWHRDLHELLAIYICKKIIFPCRTQFTRKISNNIHKIYGLIKMTTDRKARASGILLRAFTSSSSSWIGSCFVCSVLLDSMLVPSS
jgi:hypothetical protein